MPKLCNSWVMYSFNFFFNAHTNRTYTISDQTIYQHHILRGRLWSFVVVRGRAGSCGVVRLLPKPIMTTNICGTRTSITVVLVALNYGNLPVNWPKLIGPFQNIFYTFFRCVYHTICLECQSTLQSWTWYKEVRYIFLLCFRHNYVRLQMC